MTRYLKQARDGDPIAIEGLVKSLHPRISKMAAYYGRCSGEDSDDLLQEAWVGMLEALPELDLGIGRPEQYLIARARWKLLDAISRARVRRCAPLDNAPLDTLFSSEPNALVDSVCVTEFMDQLRTTQRNVLKCLLAGLTWREAGSILGCTSANIAYHVRLIRRHYEECSQERVGCVEISI